MEWPGDFPDDHAFVELLVPGASSDLDYEQLLKDTEEKLNLNASSIEQHLKELQTKMGDSRTADRPPSPTECLQWFNLRAQNRLAATGHQELLDFFKALQQYLKSDEQGKEEAALQLLLCLSSQCGVCFPCTPTSSSSSCPYSQLTDFSIHMVHTVKDNNSLEIQELWNAVRLHLRRYLMDQLLCRNPEFCECRKTSSLTIFERVHCLQQLFFLYPECEVLRCYQGLKRQHVLSVLHSSLNSSPGGETGFDRLAAGFCSAVPHLSQAITEELQVLTKVTQPNAILGFLNVTYLSTLAQELASQMEKEREIAQRDNSALSSKIKKYSTRSRASVAPMELPVKARSFSLTSHQLKALNQLACALLKFESDLRDLVTNMTFIDCMGDTPRVKGILKKSREDLNVTPDGKKPTMQEPQTLEFDWSSAFQGLVPHMEHCVKVVLDDACAKSLQQEEALRSSGHTVVTLSPVTGDTVRNPHLKEDSFYNHPESETPKMIVKFCAVILTELDALLPLAAACRDTSLLEVQSSFVEACGRAAFAMLGRLQERALEVPSSAPLTNLPALLATSIYVHQRLEHYSARLKDSNSAAAKIPLTLLPIQKYQDTIEALREQLTSYCIQVCLTSIFHDAESHDWLDPKPFYEGERCSFSLQMWFYFLCGFRSDLWMVLPAELAKDLLGQVLMETLQLLGKRYARVRASYKRHLQIRCDIAAVLLYVEHLMWSLCESPEALVWRKPSSENSILAGGCDWPNQIHSLCDQLLTVLAIVTAPVSLLYRTFITESSKEATLRQPNMHAVHWLHAINPDLFTEQVRREGLMGQTALACQLRLLTSDPGHNPKLLLRMLLHEDCHLPRMLLEYSYFCEEKDIQASKENHKAGDDFITALFNLFLCLNTIPKALTQAFEPYLERAHIWEHLYSVAEKTRTVPVVIGCVRAIVATSIKSISAHLVSMVLVWQTTEGARESIFKRNLPESVLAKIPKEWNYTTLDVKEKDSVNQTVISIAIQALSFIFTNLPLAVSSLPLSIRFLFQVAEKHLSQHARQLRSVGLLLWALLGCLIQDLDAADTSEQLSGQVLNSEAKDCFSLLAECLQAVMSIQQKGVPKPLVHKVLQGLEDRRPKWINMQLQKARKLCTGSVFEQEAERGVSSAELTEQKIGLMLLEVCHKAGGSNYLRQIYHIIQGNEELLMFKLGYATEFPDDLDLRVNFDLKPPVAGGSFNPLLQFDHIGNKKFDQSAVVDWAWDWPNLLPAYGGMSQVTFRSLLANRVLLERTERLMGVVPRAIVSHCSVSQGTLFMHGATYVAGRKDGAYHKRHYEVFLDPTLTWDFQEGAELEDEEKAMVEELQKTFLVCSCSVGPQGSPGSDETPAKQTQGETQPPDKNAAQ